MITGFVTDAGLKAAQEAENGTGWNFLPTRFGVSAEVGAIDPTRSEPNALAYSAKLDRVDLLQGGYYEFAGTVPVGAVEEDTQLREIYLLGEDDTAHAIGRFNSIVNVGQNAGATFHFVVRLSADGYAGSTDSITLTNDKELTSHLSDPHAHHVIFDDLRQRIDELSTVDLNEGDLVSPVGFFIQNDEKLGSYAQIQGGGVYIKGIVYNFPEAQVPLPMAGTVSIGLEISDTPQGKKLKWAKSTDVAPESTYYDYFLVEDGALKSSTPWATANETTVIPSEPVVRYFRDRFDNVVLEGLDPKVNWTSDYSTQFTVKEGAALIEGLLVEREQPTTIVYEHRPDHEYVEDESHLVLGNAPTTNDMIFYVRQPNLDAREKIIAYVPEMVVAPITKDVSAYDSLLTDAVERLVSVSYAGREYVISDDPDEGQVSLDGNHIKWNLNNVTPPPTGTTFIAKFVRMSRVPDEAITESDGEYIRVDYPNMVTSESAYLEYYTALPRIDALVMDYDGSVYVLHGASDPVYPTPPVLPEGAVVLATINQNWSRNVNPSITDTRVFNVPQYQLSRMVNDIDTMGYYLTELFNDTGATLADRTEGFAFADTFQNLDNFDMSMLDAGEKPVVFDIENGAITLSADTTQNTIVKEDETFPTYLDTIYASQESATQEQRLNEYEFATPQIELTSLDQIPDAELFVSIPPAIPAQISTSSTVGSVIDDSANAKYLLYEVVHPKDVIMSVTPSSVSRTFTRTESWPHHLSANETVFRQPTVRLRDDWRFDRNRNGGSVVNTGTRQVDSYTKTADWWTTVGETLSTVTRPVSHTVTIKDFRESEVPVKVLWDGVSVPYTVSNSTSGQRQVNASLFIGWSNHNVTLSSPTGTKNNTSHTITVIGSQGSKGTVAVRYADKGAVKKLMRKTTTVTVYQRWEQRINFFTRGDPIAQTFTPTTDNYLTGVSVFFTACAGAPWLEVVECINGLPTGSTIAQALGDVDAIVSQPDLTQAGMPYRFDFSKPAWLEKDKEYAIVLGANEPHTKVRVAELGKFNAERGLWQTDHPFVGGSFCSSAFRKTWTVHPKHALTFRLHTALFTQNEQTLELPPLVLTDDADVVLANFTAMLPTSDCDAFIEIDLPTGESVEIDDDSGQIFAERYAAGTTFPCRLKLKGSIDALPYIDTDIELQCQRVNERCAYVSMPFSTLKRDGLPPKVKVYVTAAIQNGTTLTASLTGTDTFSMLSLKKVTPILGDDGEPTIYSTYQYEAADSFEGSPITRVKLVLTGTARALPFVTGLTATAT